jgi:hydroxymethylpyrimidine/phosphomethylpyrimidine kinase
VCLIKGGHGHGPESTDYLIDASTMIRLAAPRIATSNTWHRMLALVSRRGRSCQGL